MKEVLHTKTNPPLVTVIMTAFNAGKFIDRAIRSIIGQTYANLQIIIVDDGSVDNSFKIARDYSLLDKRIEVYRLSENSGPSIASNIALEKVKGEFIARMDADDIAISDRIEKQVKFLLENPDIAIVGGQCMLIDEKNNVFGEKNYPLNHKKIYESLFMMNPIQHPTCIFRTKYIKENGIIYKNHSTLAHDLELVFELAQFGKLANLTDIVLHYRQHRDSLSLKNPKSTFKATVEVRHKAIKKYRYKPSIKGIIMHIGQVLLVYSLPNSWVYSLFQLLRVKKKVNLVSHLFYPAWKELNKIAYRLFA